MILLSFAGSMLAYFAFMSAASSAASAQAAASVTNWPPTAAQQTALQSQIGQLVAEVTGQPLSQGEASNLSALLSTAPSKYQATLPLGATPTLAGYQAWVLAGSGAAAAVSMQPTPPWTAQPLSGTMASGSPGY